MAERATTAITGSSLALGYSLSEICAGKKLDAPPMLKLVAAVSAGILEGHALVDLVYEEDKLVTVDFNLVATEDDEFVRSAKLWRRSDIFRFTAG